jgi:alpha-1,6-mannosyltransferase
VVAAATVMAALALFIVMRPRKADADLAGAMLLAVAFTLLLSPHYAWYFAWLVPFLCFYPVVGVIYLTCACSYLYFAEWPPTVWDGVPIYVPCIFILVAEFALRHRRKAEEPDADAVAA